MVSVAAVLVPLGLLLEMAGALTMAAPDLPVLRRGLLAIEIEEGGRRLLDMKRLTSHDPRFDAVVSVVRERWDGRFESAPQAFVFDDHPGRQEPMLCVLYDQDPPRISDEMSIRTRLDAESFDWVCDRATFYDWLGEEVLAAEQRTKLIRGAGAVVLAVGASFQAIPYLLNMLT